MTRLRKLAMNISGFVVRGARPPLKDWARAISREVEFIESDWAALRWALGSMRIIFRPQTCPLTSLSQVPRAARTFRKTIWVETILTWGSLLWLSVWCSGVLFPRIYRHPSPDAGLSPMVGRGLILAVVVYIVWQAIACRGWRMRLDGTLPAVASAYRAALERQRDFQSATWFWSRAALILAGPMLCAYRLLLLQPSTVRAILLKGDLVAGAIVAAGILVGWPLTQHGWAKYQRKIDELDALQGAGE